jgi:hypothetical protein
MIPIDIPPELLTKTVPELLALLNAGKISKDFIGWAGKKIKDSLDKKEYGFTPDVETTTALKNVTKTDAYKRMRECIGPSSYLSVIRISLRIEELSYTAEKTVIDKVRNGVYQKYGDEGITILNMGSTGILVPLIQHLSDIKIQGNCTQEEMLNRFLELVHGWQDIAIFHKTEDGQNNLENKLVQYMNAQYDIFFVFAIGVASEQAKKAISSLSNSGVIQTKGYVLRLVCRERDRKERDHFAWIFKNIYTFDKVVICR